MGSVGKVHAAAAHASIVECLDFVRALRDGPNCTDAIRGQKSAGSRILAESFTCVMAGLGVWRIEVEPDAQEKKVQKPNATGFSLVQTIFVLIHAFCAGVDILFKVVSR
jgi:hypothetical protein